MNLLPGAPAAAQTSCINGKIPNPTAAKRFRQSDRYLIFPCACHLPATCLPPKIVDNKGQELLYVNSGFTR
jgi:hypothetical protein